MILNKHNNLRNLIFFLILLAFLSGVVYKYSEWNSLISLSKVYAKTWTEELGLISEEDGKYDNTTKLMDQLNGEKKLTLKERLDIFDKLISQTRVAIEAQNNYLQVVKRNRSSYKSFTSSFLFGSVGIYIHNLATAQDSYYQKEIENTQYGLVQGYLISNVFTIFKDYNIANDYLNASTNDPKGYTTKHYSELSSLQKYSSENFKFDDEDQIKKFYPENYDYLLKSKRYLGSIYLIAKDFVSGDSESAGYKASSLSKYASDINPDFNILFGEGAKTRIQLNKEIAEIVIKQLKLIKNFKTNNQGVYPILGKVSGWKDDLVQCQLYQYKTGLYGKVLEKDPTAKNFPDLLKELSEVTPKSNDIDKLFNKDILKYTNDDKRFTFECSDDGKTYKFSITKSSKNNQSTDKSL